MSDTIFLVEQMQAHMLCIWKWQVGIQNTDVLLESGDFASFCKEYLAEVRQLVPDFKEIRWDAGWGASDTGLGFHMHMLAIHLDTMDRMFPDLVEPGKSIRRFISPPFVLQYRTN